MGFFGTVVQIVGSVLKGAKATGLGAAAVSGAVAGAAGSVFSAGSNAVQNANQAISQNQIVVAYFVIIIAQALSWFSNYVGPAHLIAQSFAALILIMTLKQGSARLHNFLAMLTLLVLSIVGISVTADGFDKISFLASSGDILWILVTFLVVMLALFAVRKLFSGVDAGLLGVYAYVIFVLPNFQELLQVFDILARGSGSFFSAVGYSLFQGLIIDFWIFVIPAWWWFLSFQSIEPPKLIRFLNILLYVGLLLLVLVSNYNTYGLGGYNAEGRDGFDVLANVRDGGISFYSDFSSLVSEGYSQARDDVQGEIARAQGKDFESEVEKGAIRQVGLTMTPLESSQRTIYADQEAIFYSRIEAKSFDTSITATSMCNLTMVRDGLPRNMEVSPESIIIGDYYNSDVSCIIPKGSFEPSTNYKVELETRFNYSASAYLERYFTKPGLMLQFRDPIRPPEDLFFQYYEIGIPPVESVRTQGPIDLALTTGNVVTQLVEGFEQNDFLLRIGLESKRQRWNGELSRVNWIIVSIPNEFEILTTPNLEGAPELDCSTGALGTEFEYIDQSACSAVDTGVYDQTDLDCDNYQHLRVIPNESHEERLDRDIVVSCRVRPADTASLLGSSPFGVRSFRARASYEYTLRQDKNFRVEKPLDEDYKPDNDALEGNVMCGRDILQNVQPVHTLSFAHTTNKFVYENITALVENADVLSADELSAWDTAGCMERSLAIGLMAQYWNQIKIGAETGFFNVGRSYYGPLRMTYENYLKLGIELDDVSESSVEVETTQDGSASFVQFDQYLVQSQNRLAEYNAVRDEQIQTQEGQDDLDLQMSQVKASLGQAITYAETLATNTEGVSYDPTADRDTLSKIIPEVSSSLQASRAQSIITSLLQVKSSYSAQTGVSGTSSTQSTSEAERELENRRRADLEEHALEYGLAYLGKLVEECDELSQGENGELDLACVLGRYQCGAEYVWGDLASCTSYELCTYCRSTLVPRTYTLAREAAYAQQEQTYGNLDAQAATAISEDAS